MQNASDSYKTLYHYTNMEGLLGILKSENLWATNYKFLNDSLEMKLFMDTRFPHILYPHILAEYEDIILEKNYEIISKEETLESITKHDTDVAIASLFNALNDQIYITSFCGEPADDYIKENGLLSQWRGYGMDGGAAIVFKANELEDKLRAEANQYAHGYLSLCDIVYEGNEERFNSELKEHIDATARYIKNMVQGVHGSQKHEETLIDGYSPFLSCISRYKHKGFSEENEVRIVSHLIKGDEYQKSIAEEKRAEKEVHYREKKGEQIPFIKLFDTAIKQPLPIKKIIVGPHREKEKRAIMLRTLLSHTNIKVEVSDIPYVS